LNYDLNRDLYTTRYFYPHDKPESLLKEIRRFIKDNPYVDVRDISISLSFTRHGDEIIDQWGAYVQYHGTLEGENNA